MVIPEVGNICEFVSSQQDIRGIVRTFEVYDYGDRWIEETEIQDKEHSRIYKKQEMNDLWYYIYDTCGCKYIKHERAFSAYITLCGYDYQEFELDTESARKKLATRLSKVKHIREWFQAKNK